MDNENSGKGKNFLIAILLLVVIGLVGFIFYDKVYTKDFRKPYKVQKNNDEVKKNINDKANEQITKVAGYYKTGQTYSTEEKPCDAQNDVKKGETTEFLFKTDGTFIYAYVADCGGGYKFTGTYTLNGSELILTCDSEYKGGPCSGAEGKYTVNEYGTIIDQYNQIYGKVSKLNMQYLTD